MRFVSVRRGIVWLSSYSLAILWTVASFGLILLEMSDTDDETTHALLPRGTPKQKYTKEGLEARVGSTFAYIIVIGVLGGFLGFLILGWITWAFLAYRRGTKRGG